MIGSKEADRLSYLDYKLLLWSRLVAFWQAQEGSPLHREGFVAQRLHVCRQQVRAWEARKVADRQSRAEPRAPEPFVLRRRGEPKRPVVVVGARR